MSRKDCEKLKEQYISNGRLKSYKSYQEYFLNLKLAKKFYIPLSIVEISFRNSLNHFFNTKIGYDWLFRDDILQADAQRSITNAISILKQQNKNITQDNLIAELSFGFWVKLLTSAYNSFLRYNDLKKIFPNLPSKQDKSINRHFIFVKLNSVRLFRNKVFHHDKIINKLEYENMKKEIYDVLSYFDKNIEKITRKLNTN